MPLSQLDLAIARSITTHGEFIAWLDGTIMYKLKLIKGIIPSDNIQYGDGKHDYTVLVTCAFTAEQSISIEEDY